MSREICQYRRRAPPFTDERPRSDVRRRSPVVGPPVRRRPRRAGRIRMRRGITSVLGPRSLHARRNPAHVLSLRRRHKPRARTVRGRFVPVDWNTPRRTDGAVGYCRRRRRCDDLVALGQPQPLEPPR